MSSMQTQIKDVIINMDYSNSVLSFSTEHNSFEIPFDRLDELIEFLQDNRPISLELWENQNEA